MADGDYMKGDAFRAVKYGMKEKIHYARRIEDDEVWKRIVSLDKEELLAAIEQWVKSHEYQMGGE